MEEFYKASTDAAFKGLFCPENNRDLLEKLLETSLDRKVEVQDVSNPEIPKTSLDARNKTLDAVIKAENDLIAVEMNANYYKGLNRRNAAYVFSKYAEETKVKETYDDMRFILQINYSCGLPKDYPKVVKYYVKADSGRKYIDNFMIIEYNVDKIFDSCYNKGEEEFKFIALLGADKDELKQMCKGDKLMEKFEQELTNLNNDSEFKLLMSAEESALKTQNTLLNQAKKEGIDEGISQGIEQNKIDIARNLLKENVDIEIISKTTGLSKAEIENLK